MKLCTHRVGNVLSLLVRNKVATLTGASKAPQRTRKTKFENILSRVLGSRDPKYPRVVPWDQKILVKIFLILFYADDIL